MNTHKALGVVSAHSMCSINIVAKTHVEQCKRGCRDHNSQSTRAFSPYLQDLTFPSVSLPVISGGLPGYFPCVLEVVHPRSPALSPMRTSTPSGHFISHVIPTVHSLRGYTLAVCTPYVTPRHIWMDGRMFQNNLSQLL